MLELWYISHEYSLWQDLYVGTNIFWPLDLGVWPTFWNHGTGGEGYILVSSPSVDMILSTHVLRNGCMDFSENLYTYYLPSEDVHLEFSYWLDNFLVGSGSEKAPCYYVQNQISCQSPFCKPAESTSSCLLVLIYNFSDIFPLHLMHSSNVWSFLNNSKLMPNEIILN